MLYRACRVGLFRSKQSNDQMTRHPTARRVKHSDAAPDDVFIARALEASTWASRNRQTVIIGAIIIAVVTIGGLYYAHYRNSLKERAGTEIVRVRATAQSGNTALAITELEKYLASFGGTPSADEARLMLGQQYLLTGASDKAIATVEPLAGDEDTAEGAQASFLLAAALESARNTERAEQVFLTLGEEAPFLFMKQDALDNAARLRLARGNAAGAVEVLERLVEITPEVNPERDVFELRLGEARAKAGAAKAG